MLISVLLSASLMVPVSSARGGQRSSGRSQASAEAGWRAPYIRLSKPRITHEPKDYTADQRALDPDGAMHLYARTAFHDPELGKHWQRWSGFAGARRNPAVLAMADRQLVMLRVNLLTHDDYGWSYHEKNAQRAGRSPAEIAKLPRGAAAGGWSEKDAALLTGVDDLHREHVVSQRTWSTLKTHLTRAQLLDYVFLVASYQLQAMYAKSLGIWEPGLTEIPKAYDWVHTAAVARRRTSPAPLSQPRIAPVDQKQYTAEQRVLDPDGSLNAYYRILLHDPELAQQWRRWFDFISSRTDAGALAPADRSLAVLRVNWLCHDDHVWGRHVPFAARAGRSRADMAKVAIGLSAGGWSDKDAALLSAVDELHTEYFISDKTWTTLLKYVTTRQLLDLIMVVGSHHVNAIYTSTVGVPPEPGTAAEDRGRPGSFLGAVKAGNQ